MTNFEVENPILNSPFLPPEAHWWIEEGKQAEKRPGRRPAMYYYREPKREPEKEGSTVIELKLVNLIRERLEAWRKEGYLGATRTTTDLLNYWRRDGRQRRLFFAQLEAAETVIFLREARQDYLQGLYIPRDEPSEDRKAEGYNGFMRYACKMATGSGKTTVMGMLAAWSILNKVADRSNKAYSDVVLAVCPNVTIRDRLQELDPHRGETSIYRTRDLVPEGAHMDQLRQGKVVITNWHVFEPKQANVGGQGARVMKTGVRKTITEWVKIGDKTTSARGSRYMSLDDYNIQKAGGFLRIKREEPDAQGNLKRVLVEVDKYVESDKALVQRILGREVGGKQNILVLNDEAHHAYRIRQEEDEQEELELFGEEEDAEEFFKEATVWVEGLDKVDKERRVNFCVDLSATPYFLARVGQQTNRPFPWVVSEFGLVDAIESGLVKIPQLAVRDTTGAEIPGYFNIWKWIMQPGRLTAAERGGQKAAPKPEAILKWAHTPIAMLGGLWEEKRREWAKDREDNRPPVFILVCKNTNIAKVIYEWLAEDKCPPGIPSSKLEGFRNNGASYTIRVDSKVVHETDSDNAKGDEVRWMRFTLDTVGRSQWPTDKTGRTVYPPGFEELADKLKRPKHPPGRDVRCIVSVGMLTEGWDCTTVTHVIGLRPFMSQLLCEQVVGRALRRTDYTPGPDGKMTEEVAKVFGVPFEVIPFKADPKGAAKEREKRFQVYAVPEKAKYEIKFPRVEGYSFALRNRIVVDWASIPPMILDPLQIPPEVEVKGLSVTNKGKLSLHGPGKLDQVGLRAFRSDHRVQELEFDLAAHLTRYYSGMAECEIPVHVLFPQVLDVVRQYVATKVRVQPPNEVKDLFLSPYYGWLIERLAQAIQPDSSRGDAPELPVEEKHRGPGTTAEVNFWTSRDVRPVVKSHVNYVVADTLKWEQSAAYFIDTHPSVSAFVKNSGLGLAIPYIFNGQPRDYVPDFLIRLDLPLPAYFLLETKGHDPLEDVKAAAAKRWCNAVNATGKYGFWQYDVVHMIPAVSTKIEIALAAAKQHFAATK